MGKLQPGIKKKGPKHRNRLHVTKDLLSSYVDLSEGDREYVERFMALQVYGDAGMDHYTPGSKRSRIGSDDPPVLCECLEMTFNGSWSKWANMIKRANLREFERREAVREMLGALISQKNKGSLNDSELGEAAEKALEWTHWDKTNCANERLQNSPEYGRCIKAIARGNNRNEATKQLFDLIRKAHA